MDVKCVVDVTACSRSNPLDARVSFARGMVPGAILDGFALSTATYVLM